MKLEGKSVKHKIFGQGKIVDNTDERITVIFGKSTKKKFAYPQGFEKHLVFDDHELQQAALDELAILKVEKMKIIKERKNIAKMEKEAAEKTKKKAGKKQKITTEMASACYNYAKKVYNKEITMDDAMDKIERETEMNQVTANDYINDFAAMMDGVVYERPMKNSDSKMFLENIYQDFDIERIKNAIDATWQHVKYYEGITGTHMKGKRSMLITLGKKYKYTSEYVTEA